MARTKKAHPDAVKKAADRAEAAAAKKAATEQAKAQAKTERAKPGPKPGSARRPDAAKPGPKPGAPKSLNTQFTPEERELFLGKNGYLPAVEAALARVASATAEVRNLYKKAKAHGFEKHDFVIAMECKTPEKEAKLKGKVVRTLSIANVMGTKLGEMLEAVLEHMPRVPAADQAYQEGNLDAAKHLAADPSQYHPTTEQYRQYMEGYHAEQERQVKAGIQETEPSQPEMADNGREPISDPQSSVTAPSHKPGPESAPPSGIGLTRADYERAERRARREAEAGITSTAVDEDDGGSIFKKKVVA